MRNRLAALLLFTTIASFGQVKTDFYGSKWLEVYRLELKELPKSALETVDSIYNYANAHNNEEQRIKALIYQSKFALILEEDAKFKVVNRFKEEIRKSSRATESILRNYLAEMYFEYLQGNRWQLIRRTKTAEKVDSTDYRSWDLQTLLSESHSQFQLSLKPLSILKTTRLSSFNALVNRFDSIDIYRPTLLDILAHNAIDFYKTGYSGYYVRSAYSYEFDSSHFGIIKEIPFPDTDSIPEVEVLKLYKTLYEYHESRKDTNAFVKIDLERLAYVYSKVDQDKYHSNYFTALDRLRNIADGHESVALIDFARASRYFDMGNKPKAVEICNKVLKDYPRSDGAKRCFSLKNHIEVRDLEVTAEQFIVPNKPSKILVSYRNIDSLYLEVYKLSQKQEELFADIKSDSGRIAFFKSLPVIKNDFNKLIDPGDYKQHTTEIVIPAMEKGAYIIVASLSENVFQDAFAYDIIQVTSVALVEGTMNNEKRFQLVDRSTGAPVSGGQIHIRNNPGHNYEHTYNKLIQTDNEGFARLPLPNSHLSILIDVYYDGDTINFGSSYLNMPYRPSKNQYDNDYVTAKAVLFTDRRIYRPGQTLYFKGILLKKVGKQTSLLAGEYVEVYLEDVNGEEAGLLRLKANEYGSFSGKFEIPAHGLPGEYKLYADMDYEEDSKFYDEIMDDFEWNELFISVEEYKRPTFEVTFDPVDKTFSVNDTVSVSGKAESFSGAHISGAKVVYAVQRVVQFPPWYGWYYNQRRYSAPVEIASGDTKTDKDGNFNISFKALPDKEVNKENLPVFNYEVTATVTDLSGETHDTRTTIKVGYYQLEAILILPENIDIQYIDNAKLSYEISNLNGQPTPAQGKITIYELIGPSAPLRTRPWPTPEQPIIPKEKFNELFPHEAYGNKGDWKEWLRGEAIKTYTFDSASAKFDLEVFSTGAYVAELITIDELGNEIKAEQHFTVFNSKSDKIADNQLFEIKIDKNSYNVGDMVKLTVGTASQDLTVVIDIDKNHKIQQTLVIPLSDEIKTIPIEVTAGDASGFAIHYYLVNYNSYESGTERIYVRKPEANIQMETITFRDKIMPGEEETWAFKVKGNKKERREVEILASMYDASLDQFKSHNWKFNPRPENQYYAYNPNKQRSFYTDRFRVQNLDYHYRFYRDPAYKHNDLNWFGFSLADNWANQRYLERLRAFDLEQISLVNFKNDKSRPKGYVYGTITSAEDGSALPGVNINIKGTTTGTVTDIDGQYAIPYSHGQELVISFIGFESKEIKPDGKNIVDVQMAADVQQLSEVVVTAMGATHKSQAVGFAVSELGDIQEEIAFEGSVSGVEVESDQIRLRGIRTLDGSNSPLYVVDGVIVSESDISMDNLSSIQLLKGDAATALYGAQAANGVVVIKTKSGQRKLDEMLAKVEARKDLRETAFFYPHLETNKQGEITFKFDAPEALTRWKLQLLAHNKELKTGYKSLNTVTQKELMVVPNAPRFLRHGDHIELSTKIVNLTEQPQQVQAKLSLFDAETNTEISSSLITEQNKTITVPATGSNIITWSFKVPDIYNAVMYKIVATNGTHSDGEQKIIPILSNRQLVTETLPMTVKSNSSKQFELKKLTDNQTNTLEHHKITLEVTSNPIWYVIKSLPYLMEYPYECSEQIFARLYSNLLAAEIVRKNEAIKSIFAEWKSSDALISNLEKNAELKSLLIQETPWLREAKSETEQQKRIALLFDINRVSEQSEATFEKLYQMQLSKGGFPWFSGNHLPNRYITQHIMAGLSHLKNLGIQPESINYDWMITRGIKYLDEQIIEDYKDLKADSAKDIHSKKRISAIQVHYLYVRSFYDHEKSEDLIDALAFYTQQTASYWPEFELISKAMIALIHFRQSNLEIANDILMSLEESSIVSEELGMYWKANDGGYRWNEAKIETQALLIEAFNEIKSDTIVSKTGTINEMKNWLFKHKQVNSWPTTKATTEAIYAVLLNEEMKESSTGKVEIQVGNKIITRSEGEAGTGYFKEHWDPKSITPQLGKVSITNGGEKLIYGGLYWQYFEDIDAITANSTAALQLSKKVFKVTRNSQGEVLNSINDSTSLSLGDLIRIRITLKTDRDMEFLHMKDQRASGLEPTTTLSRYKWQDGLGYYQATKDASTNFFFDEVPKGVYIFEYDLRVNNEGSFSNGITTIQSMYAPEFSSHSESTRLLIGGE